MPIAEIATAAAGIYGLGAAAFYIAHRSMKRNGGEAGGDSRLMVAATCFGWPLLLVLPKATLDRMMTRRAP